MAHRGRRYPRTRPSKFQCVDCEAYTTLGIAAQHTAARPRCRVCGSHTLLHLGDADPYLPRKDFLRKVRKRWKRRGSS